MKHAPGHCLQRPPDSTIRLVYCLTKRDDIDPDSFYRYWLEEHGPLVKSVAEAIGVSR